MKIYKITGDMNRILRGGAWSYDAAFLQSAYRDYTDPDYASNALGFRLVKEKL